MSEPRWFRSPTEELLRDARSWIAEQTWVELDEFDIDTLDDDEVLAGIERHYDGGIRQFIADVTTG
jgi:hypothetical protein